MTNKNVSERLSTFISDWRSMTVPSSQAQRLGRFFSAYSRSRLRRGSDVRRQPLSPEKLRTTFAQLAPPLARLRASGAAINPWVVAGLKRTEVRNAAVLASFWSPPQCGDRAIDFLNSFCRLLPDPHGVLPTSAELRAGYVVRAEHCPLGDASERVDLTIEGRNFVLGIEVKIDAVEGPEQLRRYREAIDGWAARSGKGRSAVVFLAPYAPTTAGVIRAGWRDVVAAGRAIRRGSTASQHDYLLDAFLRHIRTFGE